MFGPRSSHFSAIFGSFVTLRELCFMVYISLLIHLWSYLDTLMLIGHAIQHIVALQQVIVSSWELLFFFWHSKKHTVVVRSSTESEYRALVDATFELLWLRWLLSDMSVTHSFVTLLYCDNKSIIHISHNDVFHERTKHIEIDCHLVRYHVVNGTVLLTPISFTDQTVDIFTKTHPPKRFQDLLSKLNLTSTIPTRV